MKKAIEELEDKTEEISQKIIHTYTKNQKIVKY